MKKFNFSSLSKFMTKNSASILTGLGVAGLIATAILAIKATPKAIDMIDEAEFEKCNETEDDEAILTKKEVVKAAWKCYIPTVITGACSIACIIGSNSVNIKRNAALGAAYELSRVALQEYKNKVVETVGEETGKKIERSVVKDKMDRKVSDKDSDKTVVIMDNNDILCYDVMNDRYFPSNANKIKDAVSEANIRLSNEDYISLNDFYDELGIHHTGMGDELGWNIRDGKIRLHLDAVLSPEGKPCLSMDLQDPPKYKYDAY